MSIFRAEDTFIKIGPRGGDGGRKWDDGRLDGVREILIWHREEINAIQFVYDCNRALVLYEKHGVVDGTNFDHIQLDYPSEYLTEISGCFGGLQPHKPPAVIKSLKFSSNRRSFATVGCGDQSDETAASRFHFKVMDNKVCGFFGHSDNDYLHSIGIHFKAVPKNYDSSGIHFKAVPKNYDSIRIHFKAVPKNYDSIGIHFKAVPKNYDTYCPRSPRY